MYQQICEFFQAIPFFSSATFGIIAMLVYGSSWALTGLFLGNAPRKGFEAAVMIVCGSLVTLVFSIFVLIATKAYSTAEFMPTLLTCLAFLVSGLLIFTQQKLISVAMQNGPNGVIWAIVQSALVCPFCMGVFFFNNDVKIMHWLGVLSLIAALVFFALSKDNSSKGGRLWKYLAFICFAVTGLQQSVSLIPSYYPETFGVSGIIKSIAQSGGMFLGFVIWMLFNDRKKNYQDIKNALHNRTFWSYIILLQTTGIAGSYFLFFPGLNVMTDVGLGSMCYPMLLGSCIVAFSLISLLLLREKINFVQIAALVFCIGGLALMCF